MNAELLRADARTLIIDIVLLSGAALMAAGFAFGLPQRGLEASAGGLDTPEVRVVEGERRVRSASDVTWSEHAEAVLRLSKVEVRS